MQLSLMPVTKIHRPACHELLPHWGIIEEGSHFEGAVATGAFRVSEFCLIVFFFFGRGRKAVEPSFVNQGVLCGFFGQTAVYSSE